MRLALIGCGSIGTRVATEVARGGVPEVELVAIADPLCPAAAVRLGEITEAAICPDVQSLLSLEPSVVIEAASGEAVRRYGESVLESGADLIVVSVGAFADEAFLATLIAKAREKGRRLMVPSGAIGGVDVIRAAAAGGLDECRLTTIKPPEALNTAVYIREMGIDLSRIKQPVVVFEGTAAEAVRHFPQNLNVSVTVSLAGLGLDRTTVRLVADPEAHRNTHEVFVRGVFGEATVRLVNIPNPDNPRSSSLTSHSVIALLRNMNQAFRLGT